jgi:hypothetical protein
MRVALGSLAAHVRRQFPRAAGELNELLAEPIPADSAEDELWVTFVLRLAEEQVSAALSADVRVKSGPPREQIGPDLPRLHASRLHGIYAATAGHLPVPRPRRPRTAPEPYRGMRSRERLGNETPQKAEFG